jgi:hypothetical protein
LLWWIEKAESAFALCDCPVGHVVKYASGTLEFLALTWWNSQVQLLGLGEANTMTWTKFVMLLKEEYNPRDEIQKLEQELYDLCMKGSEIEAYTTRSHELGIQW